MIPPIAARFVAGETAVSVLDRARVLNGRGIGAICNRLGEHYDSREPADEDVEAYRRLLAEFQSRGLRACVSVKPTQLGLAVHEEVFRENLERVVDAAVWDGGGDGEGGRGGARSGNAGATGFVWIDMEGPGTTGATVDAFEAVSRANPGRVGVCLQANLDRTEADVERLADVPGKVRLVKGAYDPPPNEGVRGADAVNRAYEARLEELFATRDGPDQAVAVGTHDPRLIELARSLGAAHGTDFEVQMLMGVREDEQDRLARELDVWQYVPYGERWLAYFSRRVAERKENVLFALRAVLGR